MSEGPFIAADITLGLEPDQDVRSILEPEQAEYTGRGIFLALLSQKATCFPAPKLGTTGSKSGCQGRRIF